jgi:hypothetical protein
MSIPKVSSVREALFAFRMSLPWLKNLYTAKHWSGELDEELGEEFPPTSQHLSCRCCASPFPRVPV